MNKDAERLNNRGGNTAQPAVQSQAQTQPLPEGPFEIQYKAGLEHKKGAYIAQESGDILQIDHHFTVASSLFGQIIFLLRSQVFITHPQTQELVPAEMKLNLI